MKMIYRMFPVLMVVLCIVGCKQNAPGGEIQLGRAFDFDTVAEIEVINEHNGYISRITDETSISQIVGFVGDTVGKAVGSGKGYYEGSYGVVFIYEDGTEFSMSYGDADVFYMGKGEDGYSVRYRLCHISIRENVIPFFSQYDQSGMEWKETD